MAASKDFESKTNSLRHILDTYDIDLVKGEIRNKRTGNDSAKFQHFAGQSSSNTRYKQVQVFYQSENYKITAHRIIWAVAHKRWPAEGMVIDHINSDTSDNKISNLEELSVADNNVHRKKQRNTK